MGSMKEYFMEMEAERFEAWAEEHYPDVEPDTPEWETIANYYSWEQEAHEEQALWAHEQEKFEASLDSVHERYLHACRELIQLQDLLNDSNPSNIIRRLVFAHAVTVMEAYLMYCARALLNHDYPLIRFRDAFYCHSSRVDKKNLTMETALFRPFARRFVSRMTFHNTSTLQHYFNAVLHIPPSWPIEPLKEIVTVRQDLVHRNGVTKRDTPLDISLGQLRQAMDDIQVFIDEVNTSMNLEIDYFGNHRNEELNAFRDLHLQKNNKQDAS